MPVAPTQGSLQLTECRGGEVATRHFSFIGSLSRRRYGPLVLSRMPVAPALPPLGNRQISPLGTREGLSKSPNRPCAAAKPILQVFGALLCSACVISGSWTRFESRAFSAMADRAGPEDGIAPAQVGETHEVGISRVQDGTIPHGDRRYLGIGDQVARGAQFFE